MPISQPLSKAGISKKRYLRKRVIVAVLAASYAIATIFGGKDSNIVRVIQTIVSTVERVLE